MIREEDKVDVSEEVMATRLEWSRNVQKKRSSIN
jgi:hypothetical protein